MTEPTRSTVTGKSKQAVGSTTCAVTDWPATGAAGLVGGAPKLAMAEAEVTARTCSRVAIAKVRMILLPRSRTGERRGVGDRLEGMGGRGAVVLLSAGHVV